MQPGKLNRKITLQKPEKDVAASGEAIVTFVSVGEVWADVKPLSGKELYSSSQRLAQATDEFTIRFRKDLTPEFRIQYQGQDFNILTVIEIGMRDGLKIVAESRAEYRDVN